MDLILFVVNCNSIMLIINKLYRIVKVCACMQLQFIMALMNGRKGKLFPLHINTIKSVS